MTKETIYAAVTKHQKSAISIIRVSGPKSKKITLLFCKKEVEPHTTNLRKLYSSDGEVMDKGIVLYFPSPNSPTGEDVVEFHVHGSVSVIRKIEEELSKITMVREANPGEFTKRAFYNNKIDLLQVEGLGDLLDAHTDLQRKQAQLSLLGSISKKINTWKRELIELSSFLETTIDFSDEVVPEESILLFNSKLCVLINQISEALKKARFSKKIKEGIKIIVTGPPNAGKSSLINNLLDENLSIVNSEAGTTRDIVSSTLDLDGVLINVYDTAGLHETKSEVEREGIKKAIELSKISDIQIRIVDGSDPEWKTKLKRVPRFAKSTIDLINKADIKRIKLKKEEKIFNISTKTNFGIKRFEEELKKNVNNLVVQAENPTILRERHIKISEMIVASLKRAKSIKIEESPELIAEETRHAISLIGKITGVIDVEVILDNIFKQFCIGK